MKTIKEFEKNIEYLLETYVGGVPFFDKLDESIRNQEFWRGVFLPAIHDLMGYEMYDYYLIFSGGFARWKINSSILNGVCPHNYIIVNGGMRDKDAEVDNLSYLEHILHGRKCLFVDDSFYSGGTRDKIKNEVIRLGGIFVGTYVAYDGSQVKEDDVHSLYRYYDHYNNKGERLS